MVDKQSTVNDCKPLFIKFVVESMQVFHRNPHPLFLECMRSNLVEKFYQNKSLRFFFSNLSLNEAYFQPTYTHQILNKTNTLINLQLELEKEIHNATYFKYQAIIKKYNLNRKQKIWAHSKLLAKALEEIEGRDLTSLNFKELLALKESLEKYLQNELRIAIGSVNELTNNFYCLPIK